MVVNMTDKVRTNMAGLINREGENQYGGGPHNRGKSWQSASCTE